MFNNNIIDNLVRVIERGCLYITNWQEDPPTRWGMIYGIIFHFYKGLPLA